MTAALGGFLGTLVMLAGALGAWVAWQGNRRRAESLRIRKPVEGVITKADPPDSVEIGLPWCTVEYTVERHRYQVSVEREPDACKVGLPVTVMVLPSMPSDAVALDDLEPATYRRPLTTFLIGVALAAWPHVERLQ